jgi:hypothetical protein
MFARTESEFRDLRITGPDGAPVAWAWPRAFAQESSAEAQRRYDPRRLVNRVVTPEGALQFVVPIGASQGPHHAVTIEATGPDFVRKVLIETGSDLQRWNIAARGTIFRLTIDQQDHQSLRVSYPVSTQRYVRVTVDGWSGADTLQAVTVDARPTEPEQWELLGRVEGPVRASEETGSAATPRRRDTWELSFDYAALGGGRLVVEPATERFARSFSVETSQGGGAWAASGSGLIYRAPGVEVLEIPVGRIHPRRLRLVSNTGSDAPLTIDAVRLEVPVRRIIFPARNAGEYRFYLGAPDTRMPEYDLPAILARSQHVEPIPAMVGAWSENPDYVPPPVPEKPISERFPWLLPGVLGLAIVGMGSAAFKLLRKAG